MTESKKIVIPGDVVDQTISVGEVNVVNGRKLPNPTLPADAQIVDADANFDLPTMPKVPKVKQVIPSPSILAGEVTELPPNAKLVKGVCMGSISNSNINGVDFNGTWVLLRDADNKPLMSGGNYVYIPKSKK